jgi:hypothetical protein
MEQIVICNRSGDSLDVELLYGIPNTKSDIYTVSKGYIPTQGDSIFLMPGVNIPRVKLKDLALNLGIKVVRDASRANVIISGKATVNKITCGRWLHHADTETFTKYVEWLKTHMGFDQYYLDKYETAVAACNPDTIYIEYGTKNDMENKHFNTLNSYSSAIHFVEDEHRDMLDDIQNKPIFDESELLAMINGDDAVTITPEIYSQLVKMFESSDSDNHIMAMEIMANSNYIDSALYLLLLLEGFSTEISECHTRNHVNFKSMVSYFTMAVKEIGWLNPDTVAKKLIELGLLTKDWTHVLLQERADWFIRNIYHSTTFSVGELVPTIAIQTAINDSYTGIIEYKVDSKEVALVTESRIFPEREIESEEEERVIAALYMEEQEELLEEAITRVERADLKEQLVELENTIEPEPITEEELAHDLYGVDNDNIEVTFQVRTESNNHQIETNESTDIDWF